MLHHEVKSVLMDSLALAVFLKQPSQNPHARQPVPRRPARPVVRSGLHRYLVDGLTMLRRALSRDDRRPCL